MPNYVNIAWEKQRQSVGRYYGFTYIYKAMGCKRLLFFEKPILQVVHRKKKAQNSKKCSNYFPYGMLMPNRKNNTGLYRYGYNGKENDNEIKGDGNSIDYGARMYDPRIGRWFATDPLAAKYPSISPYVYVANNPLIYVDPDGRDYILIINHDTKTVTIKATYYTQIGDVTSHNSAIQATEFWNAQSGDYTYSIGKGEDTVQYTVNFDLQVQQVDNPEEEANNDRRAFVDKDKKLTPDQSSNVYRVLPDGDEIFKSDDIKVSKNGVTGGGTNVSVKESRADSDTGSHEAGHTLGLKHFLSGILTSASNSPNRSNNIDKKYLKKIIKNAFKPKKRRAKGHVKEKGSAPDNFRKGKVTKNE